MGVEETGIGPPEANKALCYSVRPGSISLHFLLDFQENPTILIGVPPLETKTVDDNDIIVQ